MREILDYRPERELNRLLQHVRDETRDATTDQLWEYLNFFEFVESLVKLGQIKPRDRNFLFDYPRKRIRKDRVIRNKLEPEGFERLHASFIRQPLWRRVIQWFRSMSESPFLFVYGTLRREVANEWSHFLPSHAHPVGTGKTTGRLSQLDHYPGMVSSANASDQVIGEVYRIDDPVRTWAALDEYEGDEFERKIVPVTLDDGRKLDAWAYIYKPDTSGRPRIVSGDFLQSTSR